jgi:hypothetical protein
MHTLKRMVELTMRIELAVSSFLRIWITLLIEEAYHVPNDEAEQERLGM